jgi:hypothetical protein
MSSSWYESLFFLWLNVSSNNVNLFNKLKVYAYISGWYVCVCVSQRKCACVHMSHCLSLSFLYSILNIQGHQKVPIQ